MGEEGDEEGAFYYARFRNNGIGMDRDCLEAAKYYGLSAIGGNRCAALNFAMLCGKAVEGSVIEGRREGQASGQISDLGTDMINNIGMAYREKGKDGMKTNSGLDPEAVLRSYQRSRQATPKLKKLADSGDAEAELEYGRALKMGLGIEMDLDLAKGYFVRARQHGNREAKEDFDLWCLIKAASQFEFSEYENVREIGHGSFGNVHLMRRKESQDDVIAVKFMYIEED
jgi:TPR repeat protein